MDIVHPEAANSMGGISDLAILRDADTDTLLFAGRHKVYIIHHDRGPQGDQPL